MIDRELPCNREAERVFLGGLMLLATDAGREALAELPADAFYVPAHQSIVEAIRRVHAKGLPMDLVVMRDELRNSEELEQVGGVPYLVSLVEACPSVSSLPAYADLIRRDAHRRDAIQYARDLERAAFASTDLSKVDFLLACGLERSGWDVPEIVPWSEADLDGEGHRGIATGLSLMDGHVPCVLLGEMTVVMARRGFGKTLLMGWVAMTAQRLGYPALYVSFGDMTRGQMLRRWFRMAHGVSYDRWSMEHQAMGRALMPTLPAFLDCSDRPTIEPVRRFVQKNPQYRLVVLDYAQLITSETEHPNGFERQRHISAEVRRMARQCDCAVLVGSQVTVGEGGAEGARYGQELENDAAAVIRLGAVSVTRGEQPTPDDGIRFEVVKHRHGRTGRRRAIINPQFVRLEEASDE